ncbi:glucooligosaccharide oxidase-like protein [Boeremia exigua]|uniref:glucooligosaccharide oxidase-like protein n=1 Tax=Boeremia exigua TaxID=749465 RepID=UPI001E8E5200|nr:glucooligosaccharide oxidase-like protein [Boeremia exigua]KAH6611872.1 glucooligosaccharide oxidase-like protein [Boeremia exigua]
MQFPKRSLSGVLSISFLTTLIASVSAQDATVLRTCLTQKRLQVIVAADTNWETATSPWSLRYNPEPAAVITPVTKEDIAAALACAVEAEVKVSALNGGHSYGAYGLGGTHDGALVINMVNFDDVTFNESNQLLTYGGGSRVGPVATWLWENHGLHFPHVRANWIGLAGSSIGGGFGTTTRFLGTPMDFLDSVEYMLYNGTVVKASRQENADLFWVAQGAGSSYGILLSLTTRTWKPEHERVTNFTLSLPADTTIETGVEALLAIQDYAQTDAPDTFAIRWQLATPWSGSGYFYGNPDDFSSVIAPLLERLPNTTTLVTSTEDFWTMENIATPSLNGTSDTFPPRSMYLQALVLRADQPFTYESAYALYEHTTFAFNRTDMTKFGFLDLWGGKPAREIRDTDTSHAHANNLWLVRWEGRLANGLSQWPADGIKYMQDGFKPFEDQLRKEGIPLRGFVNYRDTELTEKQWSERLYGANYERMKQIKTDVDPRGIFTTNDQSIPSS